MDDDRRPGGVPGTQPRKSTFPGGCLVAVGVGIAALVAAGSLVQCGPRRHLPWDAKDIVEKREDYQGLEGDYRYELGATVTPAGFAEFATSIGLSPGLPEACQAHCGAMTHAQQLGREHCICARYDEPRLSFVATSW